MTGALDAEIRPLASNLAREFGKTVTFVQVSSSFDPSTGSNTETTTETSLAAAPPQSFRVENMDNSLIEKGDLVIGLPALDISIEPTTQDRIKIDGDTWSIIQVAPLFSGELAALYNLQVRR